MQNWAGSRTYRATQLLEPRSVEELQGLVGRTGGPLVASGARHSFSDVGDTDGAVVSLRRLPRMIEIDAERRQVTIDGGITYAELCPVLDRAGWAVANLASVVQVTVAGACATGTHGSGDRQPSLAAAVSDVELVTGDGSLVQIGREDGRDDLRAGVVSLGCLGIVTRLTLDLEPAFEARQDVYEGLALDRLLDHFDEVFALADSVSVFTTWQGPRMDLVWLKQRLVGGLQDRGDAPPDVLGARPAAREWHPIPSLSPDVCTPQLGLPGRWHERLPHFRADRVPSSGRELQSEYLVPRIRAREALVAIAALRDRIAPLLQVSEIRSIASDEPWLSPAYGRDSIAIHFTWVLDLPGVAALLPDLEAALAPFDPRPHWAKLFAMPPDEVRSRYPRVAEFVTVAERLDPSGRFRTPFARAFVFGERRRGPQREPRGGR